MVSLRERRLNKAKQFDRSLLEVVDKRAELIDEMNKIVRENIDIKQPQRDRLAEINSQLSFISWLGERNH